MLTSKQRAKLKSMGANIDALYQLGKNEIDENYIISINAALDAKELIKIKILDAAPYTAGEAAHNLAERTDCEVVQVIGSKVLLYKKSRKPEKRELSKIVEKI